MGIKEYIANRKGVVKKSQLYSSHILAGGKKEYDNMCESLEERGEILIEKIEGRFMTRSKITLVNTEG